eukprot:TRINITY_DN3142_c1_g3_i1.p1 TRINITY_DN3142_c1_g3~~TRINITY_DN3142_c1_g3_i1.p1  ORF type:complete len:282 (+),score=66.60 TRINITY_DN3142_c1_g3_i1:150-995(+)
MSLGKIIEIKGNNNKTMLHYLAEYIEDKHPGISNWSNDLENIKLAANVPYDSTLSMVGELGKKLEKITEYVKLVPRSDNSRDFFYKVMPETMLKFTTEFNELMKNIDIINREYNQLANIYGEDPQTSRPDHFFGCISNFSSQYQDVIKEIKLEKIKKKKAEERRKLAGEKADSKTPIPPSPSPLSEPGSELNSSSAPPSSTSQTSTLSLTRFAQLSLKDRKRNDEFTIETTLDSVKSGKAFARRRLRRHDNLVQKRLQAGSLDNNITGDDEDEVAPEKHET